MNQVERIFEASEGIEDFSKKYFSYLYELLQNLDTGSITAFVEQLEKARERGSTIFVAGNGGSGATASHMANDIGTDIRKKSGSDVPFRVMSLADSSPVMLAVANDDGYNRVFVNQLRIHYRPGDILIVISASGNSPNLVEAAKWMKERGETVMSLIGFDGGALKGLSDVDIHVKTSKGEYGPVEDVHMVMDHLIANYLQYKILKESRIATGAAV